VITRSTLVFRLLLGLVTALLVCPLPAQDLFDQNKIRDFYFTFKQASWWNLVLQTVNANNDLKADLTVDGTTYTDVGFRIKGGSSASVSGNKKPFNLTMDSFVPGQNLMGSTTLNLNNGAYDPTLTREVISYHIFRNYIAAPRTAYVRVHLNNTLWGIYILIEQPNKAFLRQWFRDEDGTRYKGDRPGRAAVNTSPLTWRGTSPASYQPYYQLKTTGHPNAWTDLINLIDKLNNLSSAQFKSEIVKVLNVDRALWYLACNNAVINSDDYMGAAHNYFMYFDPTNGQMNMLPWDLNEAFGVHGPVFNTAGYSITYGSTFSSRPLTRRLLAVPEWRELYFAHYRTILNRWMDWTKVLGPLNTKFQNLILADVKNDKNYLFPLSQFDPNMTGRFLWRGHYINGLKELASARVTFLRSRPDLTKPEPQLANVSFSTATVKPGQKVQVTVTVTGSPAIKTVVLRSTTLGVYQDNPMFDDGKHGDGGAGDNVYGGTFVAGAPGLPTRFYIHATNTAGTVQVLPAEAEHKTFAVAVGFPDPKGPIVINELLADNDNGDRDQKGDFDDWFELHNTGATAYDLSGHYLSDDIHNPKKWKVPANTTIPAGGFLRIWADNEPAEGVDHATFKLSKEGEMVVLHDTDARSNQLLDGVAFGQQKGDRSFGRVPDGARNTFYIWTPSGSAPVTGTGFGKAVRYDTRRTGAPSGFDLVASGSPQEGKAFQMNLIRGPANGAAILGLSLGVSPSLLDLGSIGTLIVDAKTLLPVFLKLDQNGAASFGATVPPGTAGISFHAQAIATELTNAMVVRVSK
jgi:hypothetical protein